MNRLRVLAEDHIRKDHIKDLTGYGQNDFRAGDTVRVHVKVVEGDKERLQIFQGIVIQRRGGSIEETFTVRKISDGLGIERIFPLHSPSIDKIEVTRRGRVRRAKLFYLRQRRGKAARVSERRFSVNK